MNNAPQPDKTPFFSQKVLQLDGHPKLDEASVPIKSARRASAATHSQTQSIPDPTVESPMQPSLEVPLHLERSSYQKWSYSGTENGVRRALAIKKLTQLAAGAGAAGVGGSLLHETVIWVSGMITIGAMTFIFILGIQKS